MRQVQYKYNQHNFFFLYSFSSWRPIIGIKRPLRCNVKSKAAALRRKFIRRFRLLLMLPKNEAACGYHAGHAYPFIHNHHETEHRYHHRGFCGTAAYGYCAAHFYHRISPLKKRRAYLACLFLFNLSTRGRTTSGGRRLCADRSGAEIEPFEARRASYKEKTGLSCPSFLYPNVHERIRTSDPTLRSMAYHVIHGSDVTSNIIPYTE